MSRIVVGIERFGGELCYGIGVSLEQSAMGYPRVVAQGVKNGVRIELNELGHIPRESPSKGGLGQRLMCRALASTWCPERKERSC